MQAWAPAVFSKVFIVLLCEFDLQLQQDHGQRFHYSWNLLQSAHRIRENITQRAFLVCQVASEHFSPSLCSVAL